MSKKIAVAKWIGRLVDWDFVDCECFTRPYSSITTSRRLEIEGTVSSVLSLSFPSQRPMHVVSSFDEENEIVFVITAYEPDLTIFESDYKTKKKI